MIAHQNNVPTPLSYRIDLAIESIDQLTEANKLAIKQISLSPFWVKVLKWFHIAVIRYRAVKINNELEKFKLLFSSDEFGYADRVDILHDFNDFLIECKDTLISLYQDGHNSVGGNDPEVGETIFNVYTYGGRI